MRTTPELSLPITVDRGAEMSLPDQIAAAVRELVGTGVLVADDPLPSTRALAAQLGVSRGSAVQAYDQLLAEGWLIARTGGGTRVNPKVRAVRPPGAEVPVQAPTVESRPRAIDLRPGQPMEASLVDATWKSAWRRAADEPLGGEVPLLGLTELRVAIAEHLRRMRAVVRPAESIAVTAGGRHGLSLLLAATGARRVGVEDPGYPSMRRVLERAGVDVVPLAADTRGLIPEGLPDPAPDLVLVTPSHQYPLGGSLPVDRRQALLAWAAATDTWIVEDDYDSELRYTSQPLPALTAMDGGDRVALLGTFSKTLTPALATGFIVVPPALVAAVLDARRDLGMPVSLVTQRAVAHYLEAGGLTRHTQRMRHLYRRRRDRVVAALAGLTVVRVRPMDGGLHVVVEIEGDERALVERLGAEGVLVSALSRYWSDSDARAGIVFGFGSVSEADLEAGLGVIAGVLRVVV